MLSVSQNLAWVAADLVVTDGPPLDVTTGPYPTPNMGPTAGRAAAVAIDPKNPDVIYAGTADGIGSSARPSSASTKGHTDAASRVACHPERDGDRCRRRGA